MDWIGKTEYQLEIGEKEAILAFSEGRLAGNLVHQDCKDNGPGRLREVKNARTHPQLRDKYFMKFMLRQLFKECEGKYVGLICDARANQTNTINYFIHEGFIPIAKTTLYEGNMEEVTMFKPLGRDASLLIPKIKDIIIAKSI